MSYTPTAGSVASRVIEFLASNPDDALSAHDISIKFGCVRANVHTLLRPAVSAGVLNRVEDLSDGELVYKIGESSCQVTPSANQPFPAAPRRKPSKPFWMDLTKVAIDTNVPLPSGRGQSISWASLFARLDVGHSVLLPSEAEASVAKAMTQYRKETGVNLVKRRVPDGIRIWRMKPT